MGGRCPRVCAWAGAAVLEELKLQAFKCFSDETLPLGPFSVIVGANASGKSNIRDALRFLHGIGRGYSLADIVGGKYGAGGQVEWDRLRGGSQEIVRFGESRFELKARIRDGQQSISYKIVVGPDPEHTDGDLVVLAEELLTRPRGLTYASHPEGGDPVAAQDDDSHLLIRMGKTETQRKYGLRVAVRTDQPALSQIGEHKRISARHKDVATKTMEAFAATRFLDLSPEAMRKPAFPGQVVLGDGGENLATVLEAVCADQALKQVFADWLRELTPMDVRGFSFPRDPVTGQVHLVIEESGGRRVSAYSASDGSLRFLAMLAAVLGPDPAKVYVFEEIDNGIHPARLRLLVELIEGQTRRRGLQVITTSHSSEMLGMLGDAAFETASLVCRLDESSVIRRLADLPNARDQRQQLGRLHMGGWMENAVAFTANRARDS